MTDHPGSRTNIELRPDPKLLNRNHNGYKLSLDPVPTYRTELTPATRPDRVRPSDHRYSHLRLYGMQNHLVADPWTPGQSYYVDRSGMVQRVYCDPSCGKPRPLVAVYKLRLTEPDAAAGRYNCSLAFPSDRLCLVCDGAGTLHVLDTGERAGGREWKAQTVLADGAVAGVLLDARFVVQTGERALHLVTLQLSRCDDEREEAQTRGGQALHWSTLVQEHPGGRWTLAVTRTLEGKGYPLYCALDYHATGLLVASDHPFRFVHDSLQPVVVPEPADASPEAPTAACYPWEEYPFTWTQTEEEVCVTFPARPDVQYRVCDEATVRVYANEVQVVDGTALYAAIDTTGAVWTRDNKGLAVTLPKSVPGSLWPFLFPGGPDESGTPAPPGTDRPSDPAPNLDVPLEDCDLGPDDTYYTLERIGRDHTVTHAVWLGRVAPLFGVRLRPDQPAAVVLRYDVDACVWQLQPAPDACHLRHEGTLHTFGYVQAAKQQQKFLDCAPDLSYGVICESQRSVFLYRGCYGAGGAGLRHRSGTPVAVGQLQYVTLDEAGEILGVCCADRTMMLLTERAIVAVQVSPDEE
uniref:NudC domain-containing protein 1 n=1 Tax=Anopheles dirus TaxID=7168 RepID=A0A182N0Y0_9DIPT